MSLHQANKDKPRALKCRHFCFSFDLHNYCPTCKEAGKGDDPCVTFETPCQVCTSFSDEQLKKIQNRKHYLKKQKAETSSKDDELDLLGKGDGDSFTGSNADQPHEDSDQPLLLDLRNTLTGASINQGLDMCPFLQRKISPL